MTYRTTLRGWNDWYRFARDNRAAIAAEHGTAEEALLRALEPAGLSMGGGAAPLFVITLEGV
jgi:S-formylglutathione hydrolase FrmB